jgi:hypothetical protein
MDYLEETGKKVAVLQAVQQGGGIPPVVLENLKNANTRNDVAWKRLKVIVAEYLEDGEQKIEVFGQMIVIEKYGDDIKMPEGFSLSDLFTHFSSSRQADLQRDIAAKEMEFEQRYQEFKELKSQRAKDRANEEMVQIENELMSLKKRLDPLVEEVRETYRESIRMLTALSLCREMMKEGNDRRKAEAVKAIVSEVVCYFRYSEIKATNQPKSFLERVEITPQVGEPWECFPKGNTPGTG